MRGFWKVKEMGRDSLGNGRGRCPRTPALAFALAMLALAFGGGVQAAVVEATTPAFRLSIKHDGIRPSTGDEVLTYSSQWDGGEGATVTIAQDGAVLAEGLTGEGDQAWSVTRNGTYVLTHTTYTNGIAGAVETASFVVPLDISNIDESRIVGGSPIFEA